MSSKYKLPKSPQTHNSCLGSHALVHLPCPTLLFEFTDFSHWFVCSSALILSEIIQQQELFKTTARKDRKGVK